jgi:LPS export ABC transporter protein LptC
MKFTDLVKKGFRYMLVAGFVLLSLVFIFHQEFFDRADVEEQSSPTPSPTHKARDVRLELTNMISRKDHAKYWDMQADVIYVNEETKKGEAKNIKVVFFDEKGKPSMSFASDGADIDMESQSLHFKSKVTGVMASGEKIEIARLVWDGKKKRVFGYDSIKVTRGKSILKGKDMES